MKSWRQIVQRWTLRSAIKQGRKASASKGIDAKSGFLFIFPNEPALAKTLTPTVRDWLVDHGEGPVRVIVPLKALDETKQLKAGVQTISFEEADYTRNRVPSREMRRRVLDLKSNVVVLLSEEVDPFTETLLALAPARLKASLYSASRDEYVNLMVRPKADKSQAQLVQLLLDTITTFAGDHVAKHEPDKNGSRSRKIQSPPTFQVSAKPAR